MKNHHSSHKLCPRETMYFPGPNGGIRCGCKTRSHYSYECYENMTRMDVELLGVKKEDISVEVHPNKLLITAKRFRVRLSEKKKVLKAHFADTTSAEDAKCEQRYPVVMYTFEVSLEDDIDTDTIYVDRFEFGILTICIPRKVLEVRKIIF